MVHSSSSSRSAARETMRERVLQGLPAHAALVKLEALVRGGVRKTIDQQRDFLVVQHFDAGHVDFVRARIADVEREEVHVIVDVAGVAVELGVAVNLQMLAGIEQGPGGRGKADGADIEVVDARAALHEDAVDPGQRALVRDGIDAGQLAFENVFGNAVQFDDDDALDLGREGSESRRTPKHDTRTSRRPRDRCAASRWQGRRVGLRRWRRQRCAFRCLQRAQARQAKIAVRGTCADLRDETLGLGSRRSASELESRHGPADGAGVPHHVGARTGCQEPIEKTDVVGGTAICIQLGVQDRGLASRDRRAAHE